MLLTNKTWICFDLLLRFFSYICQKKYADPKKNNPKVKGSVNNGFWDQYFRDHSVTVDKGFQITGRAVFSQNDYNWNNCIHSIVSYNI